jgi:hypothetical protein
MTILQAMGPNAAVAIFFGVLVISILIAVMALLSDY